MLKLDNFDKYNKYITKFIIVDHNKYVIVLIYVFDLYYVILKIKWNNDFFDNKKRES